ncbi:MAG: response regulator [Candidatus Acidiferrales bacterium]
MNPTILIADDNLTVQRVASDMLSRDGLVVVTVANGVAAIKKIAALKPLVVLADVDMPGKDGYEVCEFVKAQPDLVHVRVLLAVSDADPYDQERGEQVGPDGVIKKPFDAAELSLLVAKSIEQAQALCPPSAAAEVPPAVASTEVHWVPETAPEAAPDAQTAAPDDPGFPEPSPTENTIPPDRDEGGAGAAAGETVDESDAGADQCAGISSNVLAADLPVVLPERELPSQCALEEDSAAPVDLADTDDQANARIVDGISPTDDLACEAAPSFDPVSVAPLNSSQEGIDTAFNGVSATVEDLPEQSQTSVQDAQAKVATEEKAVDPAASPSCVAPPPEDGSEPIVLDRPAAAAVAPYPPQPAAACATECAASSQKLDGHAATPPPSVDLSLVASVIHVVVNRMAPPAFSPEMLLDLERRISDEIIAELFP